MGREQPGDVLKLREYDPSVGYISTPEQAVYATVTYVMHHEDFEVGVPVGYVALGLGTVVNFDDGK